MVDDRSLLNMFWMVGSRLSMFVAGLIVVLFVVFLCFGFRSSWSPLFCFITVLLRVRFRANKTGLSPSPLHPPVSSSLPSDHSKVVFSTAVLLCLCFCSFKSDDAWFLFVPHLSFCWRLGRKKLLPVNTWHKP